VVRRMITKVQGFNARMFRGNLTPALSGARLCRRPAAACRI
jgi:hypothetical protein